MGKFTNCWEHMGCGRENGGVNAERLGVCPAAEEQILDQVHGGNNAGRSCWAVAGSFAKGKSKGTFVKNYINCELCEFYRRVRDEEGVHFWPTHVIQRMLALRP